MRVDSVGGRLLTPAKDLLLDALRPPLALVIGFGRQLAGDLLDLRLGRAEVGEAGGDDDPDDGLEAFDLLSLARPGLG